MSSLPSRQRLPRVRGLSPRICCPLAAMAWLLLVGGAFGQDDAARFSSWSKVEAASETKTYREAMIAGGAFDPAARGFLEQIALPQLQLESNRSTIERIRKRLREFLLGGIANEKSAEEATKTVASFMETLAAQGNVDLVVRVNAMLLIGELQSPDRKPWPPAAVMLGKAMADTALPKAVRIAACVGLARHVEAARGLVEEQQRLASGALPAIVSVLKEPTSPESVLEIDWMTSRCLAMLPLLGPLQPATAADVVRILDDSNRAINVRVRAASALGAAAGPESQVNAAAVLQSIGGLAVLSLERDAANADRLMLDRQYGGGAGQPVTGTIGALSPDEFGAAGLNPDLAGQPLGAQLIPREVCRRAAWRLGVLADAILSEDSKRGIALLAGDIPPAASTLAQGLRRAAGALDERPMEPILRRALTELKAAAAVVAKP